MTTRANIDRDPYDVYMGRGNLSRDLSESPFANPFIIGSDGNREECIRMFRGNLIRRLRRDKKLRRRFLRLKGKILGCHCKSSQPCHVDVVIELLEGPLGRPKLRVT